LSIHVIPFGFVHLVSFGFDNPTPFIYWHSFANLYPPMSVCRHSTPLTRCIFQIICITYICIWYLSITVIFNFIGCVKNFVASVLYYYKILGLGTTPCLRMMKARLLNKSQGISYEVTHNHLSGFLWIHNLHNNTIKRL
jgi:hypothetical protein